MVAACFEEGRLPDVFFDETSLVEADCFPLAAFLGADLPDFAVDFADFLAVVFLADDLALGAGVAAHTARAVLNARAITIAIERKLLFPKPA